MLEKLVINKPKELDEPPNKPHTLYKNELEMYNTKGRKKTNHRYICKIMNLFQDNTGDYIQDLSRSS